VDTLEVEDIPEALQRGDGSVHASTMFSGDSKEEIVLWFRKNLVSPIYWDLPHPEDISLDAPNNFDSYIPLLLANDFKVWNIQQNHHATGYLHLISQADGSSVDIGGRADYFITGLNAHKSNYHKKVLCVVEIQSKDDKELCEYQMLVYMLIQMNIRGFNNLIGFLVYNDGLVRAFKASRSILGNCVYEQNSCFHISHIVTMLRDIL
jgi:hypothetical protein